MLTPLSQTKLGLNVFKTERPKVSAQAKNGTAFSTQFYISVSVGTETKKIHLSQYKRKKKKCIYWADRDVMLS